MKKHWIAIPLLAVSALFAEEQTEEATPPELPKMEMKDIDFSKLSETFGHMLGKNLESLGFEIQLAKVFQGIEQAFDGKDAPMSESECYQAISVIQEHKRGIEAKENLAKAEAFLKENAKKKGMIVLEDKKLQYTVEQKGKGEVVKAGNSPKIRFVGTFLDGTEFAKSEQEEHITLNEDFLAGLNKGIVGMKEGEKRKIYIHPDLAFKDKGSVFPPNSMVSFEVEVVKAHEPFEEPADDELALDDDAEEIASVDDVEPSTKK